jgi:hypothetical protein
MNILLILFLFMIGPKPVSKSDSIPENPLEKAYIQQFEELQEQYWQRQLKAFVIDMDYEQPTAESREKIGAIININDFEALAYQYAWAVPNLEALRAIQDQSPIIELGAGSGYWAHLLKQMDVDIIAYDNFSWETAKTRPWFPVQVGNETSLLGHQKRALFLCWPPNGTGMATRSLITYLSLGGQTVIYVGEHPAYLETRSVSGREPIYKPGGTGMAEPEFFGYLDAYFDLVKTVNIPNWPRFKDKLFIWERKI